MKDGPIIAVFAGGTSAEREVSLGSGRACALALARSFPTRLFVLDADALPAELDPQRHVVFSMLHGTFGEDGGMQRLLERAGVAYAGCGAESSALTMDKERTKQAAAARGVKSPRGVVFADAAVPDGGSLAARLGEAVVLKPNEQGSSVGLRIARTLPELEAALRSIADGGIRGVRWLAEERVEGREISVGVLEGKALGIVEIRPHSGVFDYASKYTKGMTDYLFPAPVDAPIAAAARDAAEKTFAACGCRDYARVDFILSAKGEPVLLEINTVPGMKETSLLPKSASCMGIDFTALVRRIALPAIARFRAASAP